MATCSSAFGVKVVTSSGGGNGGAANIDPSKALCGTCIDILGVRGTVHLHTAEMAELNRVRTCFFLCPGLQRVQAAFPSHPRTQALISSSPLLPS